MKKILLTIALLLIIGTALAAEQISKDNFSETVIEPKLKEYYLPGEEIRFNVTIAPKTDDDAKKIDGRYYEFNTSLSNPKIEASVYYKNDGSISRTGKEYLKVDVKDWDDGLDQIKVKVSGTIPEISGRIAKIYALYVDIQDAEKDSVPPVVITVVNPQAFGDYVSSLESRLSSLNKKADELEDKGVSVVEAKEKLKLASEEIEEGKKALSNEDYISANETLSKADGHLSEAEKILKKAELNYRKSEVEKKLQSMLTLMEDADKTIAELKSEGYATLQFEIRLNDYKSKYTELSQKLSTVNDYISSELFDDAERVLQEVESSVNSYNEELRAMISEMQSLVAKTETPEETPTSTPEDVLKPVKEPFEKFSSFVSENKGKILIYGGAIVVLAVVSIVGYRGLKGYMRRRKFDELK